MKSIAHALACQGTIRAYIECWDIRVVTGGYDLDTSSRPGQRRDLRAAGIELAPFAPKHALDDASAVDVPRRTVYWPYYAREPYLLLHEFAHLVVALLTGEPVHKQNELDLMVPIEFYSAWYLERQGTGVTRFGWRGWRVSTSDDDKHVQLFMAARDLAEDLELLFRSSPNGLEPTFWLPQGEVVHEFRSRL